MLRFDLVCCECRHGFQVDAEQELVGREKRCPECGSASTRQTFASYLRNGPVLDPKWGQPVERAGCG